MVSACIRPINIKINIMKILNLGKSVKGKNIVGYIFGKRKNLPTFLILATVHGDEIEGWWLANYFKTLWSKEFPYLNIRIILVPEVNPDGFALKTRTNVNKVDLNRNLPTKDWSSEFSDKLFNPGPCPLSEPENKVLVDLIEEYKPKAILTLHSFTQPQININGSKESGVIEFAQALYEVSNYKIITIGDEIGYSTPGCLGTYAGFERNIPTITYELPLGAPQEKILSENINVISKAVEFINTK